MFETESKFTILEKEYNQFINELVAKAVREPIENYKQKLAEEFLNHTKSLLEAKEQLVKQSEELITRMDAKMRPIIKSLDNINDNIDVTFAEMRSVSEDISQYRQTMLDIKSDLSLFQVAVDSRISLVYSNIDKAIEKLNLQIDHSTIELVTIFKQKSETFTEIIKSQNIHLQEATSTKLDQQQIYLVDLMSALLKQISESKQLVEESNADMKIFLEKLILNITSESSKLLLREISGLKANLESRTDGLSLNLNEHSKYLTNGVSEYKSFYEQTLNQVKVEQDLLKQKTKILLFTTSAIGIFVLIITILLLLGFSR